MHACTNAYMNALIILWAEAANHKTLSPSYHVPPKVTSCMPKCTKNQVTPLWSKTKYTMNLVMFLPLIHVACISYQPCSINTYITKPCILGMCQACIYDTDFESAFWHFPCIRMLCQFWSGNVSMQLGLPILPCSCWCHIYKVLIYSINKNISRDLPLVGFESRMMGD